MRHFRSGVHQHHDADPCLDPVRRNFAHVEKAFMQGDPSVRRDPLYAEPPPERLPDVPEGSLIQVDRGISGLVSGMSGWRSTQSERIAAGSLRNECVCSEKFVKKDTTGVHGNTMVKDSFVGGVPLEVDDHLMGGPGLAHHISMERLRGKIKFGKWHRLMKRWSTFLRCYEFH